jgi:hypothetical protein
LAGPYRKNSIAIPIAFDLLIRINRILHTYLSADILTTVMHRSFVPPSGPMTPERAPADTRPPSFWRKVRVAVLGTGTGSGSIGFPYVMWMKKKKR